MIKNIQKFNCSCLAKIKGVIAFILIVFTVSSYAGSQDAKISIDLKNASLSEVLSEIEQKSGYNIFYNSKQSNSVKNVNISVENKSVAEILNSALKNSKLTYKFEDGKTIVIADEVKPQQQPQSQQQKARITVKGKIMDDDNKPVVGATILITNSSIGAISDEKGAFSISMYPDQEINVSFIGMKDYKQIITKANDNLVIKMVKDVLAMDEVIVTGIYSRKKEHFTGSSATYTAKNLKTIGNQNILQSLKSLDPSFAIVENNQFGSDPNRLPDIEVRGKTSVIGLSNEFKTDPNQPLFILDGFESKLSTISDLSMDRVQSITILKDAAATAIYGSKAANGVIVVETKAPQIGRLSVSYNGNMSVAWADLSDYNLMNSEEKLKFELLSGYYGKLSNTGDPINEADASKYYQRKAEMARGVDSYWMNEPLRVAIKHSHNIYIDGGDEKVRYGIGFNYGNTQGVMKDSDHEILNGNFKLIYRVKNIAFSNNLNINYSNATREKVAFSEYSRSNPFFRKYGEDGKPQMKLEEFINEDYATDYVYNPLYNNSLGSTDRSSNFGFTNNTDIDWEILSGLKAKARFSISKESNNTAKFVSPSHTSFLNTDKLSRGKYSRTDGSSLSFDGDFNLQYVKMFKEKHMLSSVIGMRLNEKSSMVTGYITEGFIDDEYSNPQFSTGYSSSDQKPRYSDVVSRSASFYFNTGYAYDNRYMADVSLRYDGASVFGSANKFTTTWAFGLSWNIHNESFMKSLKWLNLLKIRGSVGNPGNQNFDAGIATKIYQYNNHLQNPFGLSSIINAFGNKNLEWQKTIDSNIGVEVGLFKRLSVNFDTFNKLTDPLLVYVAVPSSTGTTKVPRNIGSQVNKGYTITLNYYLMQGEDYGWNVTANTRHMTTKYDKIGTSLDNYNKENRSKDLTRYYDGASSTALWAVRSAGIDPATGREVFFKKDGTQTFVFDYDDEVVVGNSTPKFEGVVGTGFYYKGFSVNFSFRYRAGGDAFMTALYDKVENISNTSIEYNQDKRALYDRWQKPGDIAKFRSISLTDKTNVSSRFVARENTFSGESISFGYEAESKWLKRAGVSSVNVRAYMNDIFRISSIKNERGIDYPFERSVSFSVGLRF